MKRDPVYLKRNSTRARAVEKWRVELRILSIDRVHVHALLRAHDRNPRHWVGLAKKESSAYMKRDGLAPAGGLWAVRCKCLPITDREHLDHVVDYIRDHEARRGSMGMGASEVPPKSPISTLRRCYWIDPFACVKHFTSRTSFPASL